MAIRNIVKEGDDVLRKVAKPVTDFGPKTQMLIDDMIETLEDVGNGIGLAAPQVGVLRRIFIVDLHDEEEEDGQGLLVFVNPEILETSGTQICQEGCLSIPDKWGDVERPYQIKIRAQDRHGEFFEMDTEELMANVIAHENDHLDGILFIDKVIGELITT